MQQSVLDKIKAAHELDPQNRAVKLGLMVAEARLSMGILCQFLEVSSNTLYRWMYGDNEPTQAIKSKFDMVYNAVEEGLRLGVFPKKDGANYSDLLALINKTNG